jgi:2-polyprenyl-3-methyl-5-hydroxy-6-metoxy-1,4-benzoquinol methylase
MTQAMECTSERMVPEHYPARVFWEHILRYRFASSFVKGKRVLDISCGEGYGSDALAKAGAASVTGVDISAAAVEHAKTKYGLNALVGNAEDIPLEDGSVDVVVSFETVEHVPHPDAFIAQCHRVLSRGGILIMSTPERRNYSPHGRWNEAHVSEMTEEEFLDKLGERFVIEKIYTQSHTTAACWSRRWLSAERNWCRRLVRSAMQRDRALRRLPGYWRLRDFLFGLIGEGEPTDRQRHHPHEAILARNGLLTRIFHPCHLRIRDKKTKEAPMYLVVVARPKAS